MTYLTQQETDFYTWLDQCPAQWYKTGLDNDSVTYTFFIDNEEEEDED